MPRHALWRPMTIALASVCAAPLSAVVALPARQAPSPTAPGVTFIFDRNTSGATRDFRFPRVPSPARDDAAAKATLTLVEGERDPNSAGIGALVDGILPAEEDDPGANFFFNAGTSGGTFRMDLGAVIDIAEIETYSWHPSTRGPQVYTLYASDAAAPGFDPAPKGAVDPGAAGWTWIANVDTRLMQGDDGGQYGVRLAKTGGSLGRFRYLLFLCRATEVDDDWGNTFYSEIDVRRATAAPIERGVPARRW